MPLMSAADVLSAGHETALDRCWLGMAVQARGVTVPEGDVCSSPVVQPAGQASAARSARIPLCR
jgi:hypothetical protein